MTQVKGFDGTLFSKANALIMDAISAIVIQAERNNGKTKQVRHYFESKLL